MAGDRVELEPLGREVAASPEGANGIQSDVGRRDVPRPTDDAAGRIVEHEGGLAVSSDRDVRKPTFDQKATAKTSEEDGAATLFHDIQALDRLKL